MRPFLIAIAGPSGSGKTEIARRVAAMLDAPILPLDSYYLDLANLPFAERQKLNFDDPCAFDHELLVRHVAALARAEEIAVPVYDFSRHTRAAEVRPLRPAAFAVIKGIFALYWEELRRLADVRVFVDAPDEVCLARRLERDTRQRGRSTESVIEQFAATVQPMAARYVRPTRRYADLELNGAGPLDLSTQAVMEHVQRARSAAG